MRPTAIKVFAGPRALRHLQAKGLRPEHVTTISAAAGGPKGLALMPFDRWLFGHWLANEPRPIKRQLIGASIGAWRMAAASRKNRQGALNRLQNAYLERQRYPEKPSTQLVSAICRQVVNDLINNNAQEFLDDLDPNFDLQVVTARSAVQSKYQLSFAKALLFNSVNRKQLQRVFTRSVFVQSAQLQSRELINEAHAQTAFYNTNFATDFEPFTVGGLEDSLLASGTIPMIADPVVNIAGTQRGAYWDGGLTDYHLYLNYQQLDGLALIPHFGPQITAGWLDKFLPWRKHGVGRQGASWLDNAILVCPSPEFLHSLPNKKLPDRQDFYAFGLDHDARLKQWNFIIGQCQYMADDFAKLIEQQNFSGVRALPLR